MANQQDLMTEVAHTSLVDDEDRTAWRAIGSVASAWVARVATERTASSEPGSFAPVAWAAE